MASKSTRNHDEIRHWAESRGAVPTVVGRTGGMLRFEFDPQSRESLHPVSWDDFFKVFDEKGLELLFDDKPGSRFHKLVYPETIEAKEEHKPAHRPARASKHLNIESSQSGAGAKQPAAEEEEEEESQNKAGSRSRRTIATRDKRVAGGKVAYGEPRSYGEED